MINIVICGSRHFTDYSVLSSALDDFLSDFQKDDICIVSGGCRGADSLALRYAQDRSISFLKFPADWQRFGKSAGVIRNFQMLEIAYICFGFHDGVSRGTAHMLRISRKKNIRTEVYYFANQLSVF